MDTVKVVLHYSVNIAQAFSHPYPIALLAKHTVSHEKDSGGPNTVTWRELCQVQFNVTTVLCGLISLDKYCTDVSAWNRYYDIWDEWCSCVRNMEHVDLDLVYTTVLVCYHETDFIHKYILPIAVHHTEDANAVLIHVSQYSVTLIHTMLNHETMHYKS